MLDIALQSGGLSDTKYFLEYQLGVPRRLHESTIQLRPLMLICPRSYSYFPHLRSR